MSAPPLVLVDGDTVGRRRTGDESYTIGLLRELPDAAPDLRYACSLRDPRRMPRDVPAAVERLCLPVASPYRRIPWSFPRLAKRAGAALAHVHYFVAPWLPCPAVVTVHDLSFAREPALFSRRDRLLLRGGVPSSVRRARRVIAVSQHTRRDLCELIGLDPARVVAVPNGVGPRFRPTPGREAERPFVLSVGALQPRKNLPALVDAFAVIARRLPHRLLIAGGDRGGEAAVRARIHRHGLDQRVVLLGHVDEAGLPELYSAADAFCFPSLYEGFGLPALEAMACGTPVAASATTGLGEAVGSAGLLFDPRSATEIAAALERLLTEPALATDLRERGCRRAAQFSWRRAAEATAAVYRDAL